MEGEMALKDLVSRPERTPERPAAPTSPPATAAPAAPKPAAATPAPRGGMGTTFLDASTVFEGVIHSGESLRLDGRVKGEIRCDHSVVVGESAHLEADIQADAVVVAGEVHGHIQAGRKITLGATARVVGDLTTPGIVIEEGATLQGRIQIGPKASAAESKPKQKAAAPQAEKPRETKAAATPPPPGAPPPSA
jgi:cytoskeletal protein CcmA (bactofilin family)